MRFGDLDLPTSNVVRLVAQFAINFHVTSDNFITIYIIHKINARDNCGVTTAFVLYTENNMIFF